MAQLNHWVALMFRLLRTAFTVPMSTTYPKTGAREESLRKVVSARTHGNMRIQRGEYYTKRDIDEQFERIRRVEFAER